MPSQQIWKVVLPHDLRKDSPNDLELISNRNVKKSETVFLDLEVVVLQRASIKIIV